MSYREFFRRQWLRVQEPRVITVLSTCYYLAALYGGIRTLQAPPLTISAVIGTGSVHLLGWLLTLGGVLGVLGTPYGYWIVEKLGLMLMVCGLGCYLGVVVYLEVTSGGSRSLQLTGVFIAFVAVITRLVRIWPLDFDPEKDARKRLNTLRRRK